MIIISSYPSLEYTLIRRNSYIQPFVVAYKYNREDNTWAHSHYFDTLAEAMHYITEKAIEQNYIDEIIHIF